VSLAGCSSQGIAFSDGGSERSRYSTTGSVPIPSEPVYGVADAGKGTGDTVAAPYKSPAAASYQPAIQRDTLAPVGATYDSASSRAFGQQPGAKTSGFPQYASNGWGNGQYVGGSYAMGPVEAPSAAPAPAGKRYAASDYPDRPPYGYQQRYDGYKPRYEDRKPEPYGERHERRDDYSRKEAYGDDYVVVEGDTLFGIAKRHGLSTTELAELNGINGSAIYPGQRLRVHGGPKYTGAPYEKGGYRKDHGDDYPGYKPRGGGDAYVEDHKAPVPAYGSYSDYRPGQGYGADKGPDGRGYGPRPDGRRDYADRHDDDRPDQRYANGYGDKPNGYGDKPNGYAEKRGGYAEKPHGYADGPYRREPNGDRYASRYERDKHDEAEERHGPYRAEGKGSYYNYHVQPGDTLYNIAQRNGLNQRELADYNDVPPTATLYPGQVLRLPKGKGYNWSGGRDRPEEESEEQDDRYAPREGARNGYPRRSPFSQKAPDQRGAGQGERRLAKADGAAESKPRNAPAEKVADQREPAAPPAASPSQPILAAHRDASPAAGEPAGGQSEAKDCESALASPASRSASTFREPVQGVIIGKFGSKEDGQVNDGIDFSVPKGTPVKAAENGVVAYVGNELPGFGNLILVRHADGYVTAYAHTDETLVRRCDMVKRGEVIAKAGATGKVTKPQLHFELRKDSKPIDPEAFFSRS
jgi:murein DD-endopeptidase MepM/ murein hydrolase activator NlpD